MEALGEFWKVYKQQRIGLVGLGMLIILLVLYILAPIITMPNATQHWRDSVYWSKNPQLVPPYWVSYIQGKKYAGFETIYFEETTTVNVSYILTANYHYDYDVPPRGLELIVNVTRPYGMLGAHVYLTVIRPDNESILLINESLTYIASTIAITIQHNRWAKAQLITKGYEWGDKSLQAYLDDPEFAPIATERLMSILFSKKGSSMSDPTKAVPLKGDYKFILNVTFIGDAAMDARIHDAVIKTKPSAYGLLGTDDLGEDLFVYVIWGIGPALLIGVLSSLFSSFIGLIYGVISGYYEGRVGELLRRINDLFYVLPVFPILLMISFYVKYSQGKYVGLWILTILIAVFSWPGMAVVIRSMTMQIKEEEFVEAAKAAGAGDFTIIFKHIMPQVMPYVFANIALGVPAAILTEAGLSFLGLGDPTSPTWGQILHYAHRKGGVRYWWWVVPPGIMISMVGLSFAFIGMAIDRVLNPKLREY